MHFIRIYLLIPIWFNLLGNIIKEKGRYVLKRKLLALLLIITMLAVTISVGLPTISAAGENLLETDMASLSKFGNTWKTSIDTKVAKAKATAQKNQVISSTLTAHAIKYAIKNDSDNINRVYSLKPIKIEQNTTYTMSFWTKVVGIKGITVSMYEPEYTDVSGNPASSVNAIEGQNIYSYKSDDTSLRTVRDDIVHTWKIGQTSVTSNNSMFVASNNGVDQILSPDYPDTQQEGEWVQVVHTFATADNSAHEAEISYEFSFPSVAGGEFWIADIQMTAHKEEPVGFYTPKTNDVTLGLVSKNVPLFVGKNAEISAEPFGANTFDGWYVGNELITTDRKYTFTYDPNNAPQYEARFTKGAISVENGGYENSAEGLVAQAINGAANWSETSYLTTSKDGGVHFVEDTYAQDWRKANVTSAKAHTGTKSLMFEGQYGAIGRKITGLEKNTEYVVSVYAFIEQTGTDKSDGAIKMAFVTAGDKSPVKHDGTKLKFKNQGEDGVILKDESADLKNADLLSGWQKLSFFFDSGDNNEVILWLESEGSGNVKLYLDNFAIKPAPPMFTPKVNNGAWGMVTPKTPVEADPGTSITVSATPYDGATFKGWYIGETCLSVDAEFTFNFTMEHLDLTAVFEGIPGKIANGDMEAYNVGDVLASYNPTANPQFTSVAPWSVDAADRTWDFNATVSNAQAHSGTKSVKVNTPWRYTGYRITNLKPNTAYVISFYAYITQKTDEGDIKAVNEAFVSPTNQPIVYSTESEGKTVYKDNTGITKLGQLGSQVVCYNEWKEVEVSFTTTDVTDVTLWLTFMGSHGQLYLDDFVLNEALAASYSAALGGEATANFSKTHVPPNTQVVLTATPYEGNTFKGWTDETGKVVSTDAVFTFTATEDFNYVATFDGPNKPPVEVLELKGIDGSFETYNEGDVISGWRAIDKTWPKFDVTKKYKYLGEKSLRVLARYQAAVVYPITGLIAGTDYRLSFYVFNPDPDSKTFELNNFYIVDSSINTVADISSTLASVKKSETNSGWNRIDMYFNSGSNTSVNFIFKYISNFADDYGGSVYFDNFYLHMFETEKGMTNGDFEAGTIKWQEDAAVVNEDGNNVLKLDEGKSTYNNIGVDEYSAYEITFKAKGNGTAAALDLANKAVTPKNYLSSVACVDIAGDGWQEYTYKLYTGPQKIINIAFKGGLNGVMIDDVKVEKSKNAVGSIIEKVDFDSDRFDLTSATDTTVYSLYSATEENDPNVYSGNRSLKFTYNQAIAYSEQTFNEAYLSYQPQIGANVTVSFKYKFADGNKGGVVTLAPEYSGEYGVETGFEHSANDNGWNTISFYINNSTHAAFKAKIASIAGLTKGDFYIDDIVFAISPPMVLEENVSTTYCEQLYNAVDNESFESKASNEDWANLPSTAKIVEGDALKGTHFLRASAGTHYVIPVEVQAGKEYYFAASVRGNAKTVGYIGLAVNAEGTEYYVNRDNETASLIKTTKSKSADWNRTGFKINTDTSGIVYLVIDVTSGAMDIDSVMMFTTQYGYRYDPNDYTVYAPYDYNNLKSATTVINGGFGDQPYYKGDDLSDDASPSTGDSLAVPVICIVVAFLASAMLLFTRKRKEGAENA